MKKLEMWVYLTVIMLKFYIAIILIAKHHSQIGNSILTICEQFLYYKLDTGDPVQGIEKGELLAGLQISVFHRTLADQNLVVSDEIPPVFGYYEWRIENMLSLK